MCVLLYMSFINLIHFHLQRVLFYTDYIFGCFANNTTVVELWLLVCVQGMTLHLFCSSFTIRSLMFLYELFKMVATAVEDIQHSVTQVTTTAVGAATTTVVEWWHFVHYLGMTFHFPCLCFTILLSMRLY